MDFEAAAIAYIRHVLDERGQSISALAKDAHISPSTLSRALNDPEHKFTLSMKTIEKIATASGINPAPFLQAKNVADLNVDHMMRPDQYDERIWGKGANAPDAATKMTLIVGDIAAGKFVEPSVLRIQNYAPIFLTDGSGPAGSSFGCVVTDDSADLIASQNEILFCLRLMGRQPRAIREVVVVETRSENGFAIELSARLLTKREDHWELSSLARADHKKGQKPKYFNTIHLVNPLGNERTKIIGFVTYVVRLPI